MLRKWLKAKHKILVIDDNVDICDLTKIILESTGEYDVDTAYSGTEGLKKAKESPFDLFIMDYKMPGIGGKELLESLKKTKPDIPVIIFSIYFDDPDTIDADIKDKADDIIRKPIGDKVFIESIKRVLAKKKKENQGT